MKPEVKKGISVISKKGRDKGRVFVVLYMVDAEFAFICDGDTRKVDHLKRKKAKHLAAMPYEFPHICESYEQGKLLDSDLRKALKTIQPEKADD